MLWAVTAELLGVKERVSALMDKVYVGLGLLMGLGSGLNGPSSVYTFD